jgi:sulfotransferase
LIELIELALERPVKILTTIRSLPCILASFEKLYRKELKDIHSPMVRSPEMSILSSRLDVWSNGVVGSAFNSIQDACMRGHRDKFHFISYEDLTTSPKTTMMKAYEFLGKDYFNHDFNNVHQYTIEKDIEHGFTDLHTIRPVIAPQKDYSKEVLGSLHQQFEGFHYNF